MKKIISSLPKLMIAAALSFAVGCNSGSSTEETSSADSVGNSPGASTSGDIGGDSAGIANTPPTNDANAVMTDTGLISKNIVDNMTEIQLSKLGKEKGTNAQVKKIATQMITDHTQMLSDMKTLAGKKNVQVPTGSTGDTSMLASMRSSAGKDFDNSWSGHMLTMHEAKIKELENALSQTQDADLKASINKALPKIRAHRDMLSKLSTGAQSPQ
jgi:putative membrane protein